MTDLNCAPQNLAQMVEPTTTIKFVDGVLMQLWRVTRTNQQCETLVEFKWFKVPSEMSA